MSALAQTFKLGQATINEVMNDTKYHTLDDTIKALLPQLCAQISTTECHLEICGWPAYNPDVYNDTTTGCYSALKTTHEYDNAHSHYHMEDVKHEDSPEVLIKQETPKTEDLVKKKEEDDSEDDI
ncbi:hypothetical protein FQN51_000893 [Onygenales sp. PD_10]|nr:hypothetical protein FQN51_000893 [Onygenales sp. PD_10]